MEQETTPSPSPETSQAEKSPALSRLAASRAAMGGIALLLVILIGGGAYAFSSREKERQQNDTSQSTKTAGNGSESGSGQPQSASTATGNDSAFLAQNGEGCTTNEVAFTSAPIPTADLGYLEPMGKMLDGHVTPTDHVYMHPKNSRAADNTYSSIMPADGVIVGIGAMPGEYVGDRAQEVAPEDHRVTVMHSCRYFSIFIHVHKLDPALTAVVGTLKPNENKKVSIPLKAGDRIGGIGSQGYDWTLVDTETKLAGFITPSLYEGESWKIHAIDPTSVYTGELKATLEKLSMRSVEPIGGKIDYDKEGALIGNWFREGSKGYSGDNGGNGGRYWDGHLSVVPDYVDPSMTVVSIGNWQGSAAQFAVKGSADPSAVIASSGPVKYEMQKLGYSSASGGQWTGNESFAKGIKASGSGAVLGTVMMEVLDGEKLKVEKFVGKTAAQVTGFTEAAQTYYR